MSSAAASLSDLQRLSPRRELVLGAALTAGFGLLVHFVGPAPGDAPVHLYRTFLVRDGALVWDNFWYAGTYPLASYSLLYYLPAALVGNLPLVFVSAVASTVLFASIVWREWGRAALWPARVFGVLAAAPMFTGLYAYSLGFTAMLATLKLLQLRRLRLAAVVAALTVGFSPLAFAFLCLIVGAYAISQRRIARRHVWFGVGLGVAAGIELLALVVFPASTGFYPFHWVDFMSVLLVSALGLLVAREARGAGPLVAFYALWGLGSVVVYIVPSPLGDNWTRLSAFVFPIMLLTASLAGFRPRRLVVLALAAAFAYNLVPYALLLPFAPRQQHAEGELLAAGDPFPACARPARVPRRGRADGGALGVVLDPESRLPARARLVPAARRRRQPDSVQEQSRRRRLSQLAPLERRPLRPPQHDDAARLGRRSAGGACSARPHSGLQLVFRSRNWTVYELPHATPLLTGPANPVVTSFGHTTIGGTVFASGRYLLRDHYSSYLHLQGSGCVSPGPGGMTFLDLTQPGRFVLSVPGTPDGLVRELFGGTEATCDSG